MNTKTETTELEKMKAELQDLKDRERIRARYGPNLDEKAIAHYKELEQRKAREKAERPLREQQEWEARERAEQETLALALDLFNSGHLVITVGGRRVAKINADASVPCPSCSAPIAAGNVLGMANYWKGNPSPISMISTMHSAYCRQGFPITMEVIPCPGCHEQILVTVQLVL